MASASSALHSTQAALLTAHEDDGNLATDYIAVTMSFFAGALIRSGQGLIESLVFDAPTDNSGPATFSVTITSYTDLP